MTWELNIKKAENGYICEWDEGEEQPFLKQEVIEENNDVLEENIEIDTMMRLLQKVREYFGVNYSKHNTRNLVIKVEETNNE